MSWRPRIAGSASALLGLALLLSVDDLLAGLGLDPSAATFARLTADAVACGLLSLCAAWVTGALPFRARNAALVSAGLLLGCTATGLV